MSTGTLTKLKLWLEPTRLGIILGAAALSTLLLNLELNLLEAKLYDFRMALWHPHSPSSEITLISIDDKTIKTLDEVTPLPLDYHTRFIEALENYSPKSVGYLVDMNRVASIHPDLFNSEWGKRFVNGAARFEERKIPFLIGTKFDVTGEVLPPFPLSVLPHSILVVHKDGNVFAEDNILRRAVSYLYDNPVFHLDMARKLGRVADDFHPRGAYYVPQADGEFFLIRYTGDTSTSLQTPNAESDERARSLGSTKSYARLSFMDILTGKADPALIDGKILLVGTLTRDDSTDFVFTPYSKNPQTHPKLIAHANILQTILDNSGIVRAPSWVNWATTFILTALVLGWVLSSTPLYGVIATLLLAIVFMALSQIAFAWKGLWIRESQPLVGMFLSYYIVVPYRLIREYKKRWNYQRTNQVLVQVEELKTNFLNLVTHDLKTPVARIQGLAEVILRNANDRLKPQERENLGSIVGSTDELNRFITTIMELSRVESNRLSLQLESKDINRLVEDAIEKLAHSAKVRSIALLTDLEPLFPIKVDAQLISKVLANLVDNAIKYSPDGATVTIRTRETPPWVEIAVSDQGIGLTEQEQEHLFTRFYRVKNSRTSAVAGTGLGLYLTKYFVEAHHGRVLVESVAGQGSTFRILIPLEIEIPQVPERKKLAERIPGLRFITRSSPPMKDPKKEKHNV